MLVSTYWPGTKQSSHAEPKLNVSLRVSIVNNQIATLNLLSSSTNGFKIIGENAD